MRAALCDVVDEGTAVVFPAFCIIAAELLKSDWMPDIVLLGFSVIEGEKPETVLLAFTAIVDEMPGVILLRFDIMVNETPDGAISVLSLLSAFGALFVS